jgi:hypothetical protein
MQRTILELLLFHNPLPQGNPPCSLAQSQNFNPFLLTPIRKSPASIRGFCRGCAEPSPQMRMQSDRNPKARSGIRSGSGLDPAWIRFVAVVPTTASVATHCPNNPYTPSPRLPATPNIFFLARCAFRPPTAQHRPSPAAKRAHRAPGNGQLPTGNVHPNQTHRIPAHWQLTPATYHCQLYAFPTNFASNSPLLCTSIPR